MSRVHEALRRAGVAEPLGRFDGAQRGALASPQLEGFLEFVRSVRFEPAADGLLLDGAAAEPPGEELRTIRTRMNHMQSLQPIRTVVVSSPSPAEGKSFLAANLALSEAQLAGNLTLLCDFDFRRPVIHDLFGIDRGPGISDYLLGKIPLQEAMRRIGDSNLYVMPAGEPVTNPLELLSLKEVKRMLDRLAGLFNWILLDSPPLLVAADANLLATLSDGSILVARIGVTTADSITRAMQSLCQNNILGIVVNGAHRGELYGKYSYYHSYDASRPRPSRQLPNPDGDAPTLPKSTVI